MGNKITRRCSSVDERYTRPQGLYPQRDVDQKKLRRLILDSKLAPCFPGEDEPNADFEECPICFLCYPSLNRSKCCSKGVCTECYLQMKSPRAARAAQCPFCKSHNYNVEFRGVKTLEEKSIEAAEEQKVIEAKIRMRKQELLDDEEREKRQKENTPEGPDTPSTPVEELEGSPLVELLESCSSHAELIETPQQIPDVSSCDDVDSPRDHEESGSEESLAPQQPVAPSPPSCQAMESEYQLRPAPPGYARHRDDEFDFDLEDIMVMEAIWLSIQEQGTCHRNTASEPLQMASTQLSDSVPDLAVDADPASISQAQSPPTGSEARDHRGGSGTMTGGLATAIAALAERHAMKGEQQTALQSLQTYNRASTEQVDAGTSSSSCAQSHDLSCAVATMNSSVVRKLTRPDINGETVMLPQTFEEQMMLAMALSITDAQSRARLEDSHPRPLPNVS